MKVFTAHQLRQLDERILERESISSVTLMERAAALFTETFTQQVSKEIPVVLFCGTGNNGGDGLAIFQLLEQKGYTATCYLVPFGTLSEDCQYQFDQCKRSVILWNNLSQPTFDSKAVIIDALLGFGTNRSPEGEVLRAIQWMNTSGCTIFSVDLPSGLPSDVVSDPETIVCADFTFTFHAPKLTFLLASTAPFVGKWKVLSLTNDFSLLASIKTRYSILTEQKVRELLPHRPRFSHKGTFGKGLLVAGSEGKMGASVLSSKAALKSGLGLLTLYTVKQGRNWINGVLPEVMTIWDEEADELSGKQLPNLEGFQGLGIGPGVGTHSAIATILKELLNSKLPLIIDADALTVLAKTPELWKELHENCLLTPHPKEFSRLVGQYVDDVDRLERAVHFAQTYRCNVLLKDAYSAAISFKGEVVFNLTGNSGLAKGGSGDVLTGILIGLITQGIDPFSAAQLGSYYLGKTAEELVAEMSERAILASDIVNNLKF